MAIRHKSKDVYLIFFKLILIFFSLKISLLDHATSFDLSDLKNVPSKPFENSLKKLQIFQRLMEGMNQRGEIALKLR